MTDSRYIVLKQVLAGAEEVDEWCLDIRSDLTAADVPPLEVCHNLDRFIILSPGDQDMEVISTCLADMDLEISDHWLSGPASGVNLQVELHYHDENQTVSATIDEGLLSSALCGTDPFDRENRRVHAVTALAGGNEFTHGYGPLNENMELREIVHEIRWWDEDGAIRFNPGSWQQDEPMVEVSFRPEAIDPIFGSAIEVAVDGMQTEWKFPRRLLPQGVDLEDQKTYDLVAFMPCTPLLARKWAEIAPFSVSIEDPEILSRIGDADMPDTPGF